MTLLGLMLFILAWVLANVAPATACARLEPQAEAHSSLPARVLLPIFGFT
jgi:hypothetical protein